MATVNRAARFQSVPQVGRFPAYEVTGPCRMHGGASTGPRTPEGLARSTAARWRHGKRDAAARAQAAQRGVAQARLTALRRLVAEIGAELDAEM
jgi:hypothetical protein